MIEIIPFAKWQEGIAPLWDSTTPSDIPIYNDPFGIIRYPLADRPSSIIFMPVQFRKDGVIMGYSSVYNISDSILRIRGVYILPEFRGHGVAHQMVDEMIAMWPKAFYRTIGFWREDSYSKFIQHSGMDIVPETDWLWSKYSSTKMKLLYRDRGKPPAIGQVGCNRLFINGAIARYGMGGSNNLNVEWSEDEWLSYFTKNRGEYDNLECDLDFVSDGPSTHSK